MQPSRPSPFDRGAWVCPVEANAQLRPMNLEDCGINGESGAQLRGLRDIKNRWVGLARVRDEEYRKRAFLVRCERSQNLARRPGAAG